MLTFSADCNCIVDWRERAASVDKEALLRECEASIRRPRRGVLQCTLLRACQAMQCTEAHSWQPCSALKRTLRSCALQGSARAQL